MHVHMYFSIKLFEFKHVKKCLLPEGNTMPQKESVSLILLQCAVR